MEHGWPDHRADKPVPPWKDALASYDKVRLILFSTDSRN